MSLIIGTIQLFKHPLFQERLIVVIQAFKNPYLKLLFQYPNTYTLWSLNRDHRMSTSFWQSLRSYIEGYWMSSSILQVFSNVYYLLTTTVFSEYLLDSTVNSEIEQELPNVYQPSTVSAELEQWLPNVYRSLTKMGPVSNIRPPPIIASISCKGLKLTRPNKMWNKFCGDWRFFAIWLEIQRWHWSGWGEAIQEHLLKLLWVTSFVYS